MRIWKWTLKVTDIQTITPPKGAEFLSVQMQGEECSLWALCDENMPPEPRKIAIYGTGHHLPNDPGKYISTFQLAGADLVFHAFEVPNG